MPHKEAHFFDKEAPEPHKDINMLLKEARGYIGFICTTGTGLCLPISSTYRDGLNGSVGSDEIVSSCVNYVLHCYNNLKQNKNICRFDLERKLSQVKHKRLSSGSGRES